MINYLKEKELSQKIGLEVIKLILTQRHWETLKTEFHLFLKGSQNIDDLPEGFHDDHSILYMSIQHLKPYFEFANDDFENHYLGHNIRIIKREKIIELLSNEQQAEQNIIETFKQNVFEIINEYSHQQIPFAGQAYHYFLGNRITVNFELNIDLYGRRIEFLDVYGGIHKNYIEPVDEVFTSYIGRVV